MGSIDINGNQLIDYEEFIAATIHLNKLNREDLMMEAFKYFDKDNSGFITQDELMVSCLPTRGVDQRGKGLVDQGNLAARVVDTNLMQAAEGAAMQGCAVFNCAGCGRCRHTGCRRGSRRIREDACR